MIGIYFNCDNCESHEGTIKGDGIECKTCHEFESFRASTVLPSYVNQKNRLSLDEIEEIKELINKEGRISVGMQLAKPSK